ncbi:cardiolipin synthase [Facklamia miroungae]|uniref:Cardiolipin synthase n=1 Tax=Facklamia miroungae TaxID=120956 RepID=A0A1G7SJ39_9LACT|nr:cardiolipin synthase [Facklamia miroungae]NKZ29634.1 cardiolipin synthase [Facklamia miroungae]SDG23013.1 cardiolipin synthase [Facklamia miroungae]
MRHRTNETKPLIVRLVIIAVLIILQIVWLVVLINDFIQYSVWLNIFMTIISFGIIIYLLDKNESPAYRLSWIVLLAISPIIGSLFYLYAGNKRPLSDMIERISRQDRYHKRNLSKVPNALGSLIRDNPRIGAIAKYVNDYAEMPVSAGVDVKYFPNGEAFMEPLIQDLKSAKSHIFLEFFIIEQGQMFDQIFDVLKQKAQEGVEVRLIYDDFGCLLRLPNDFVEQMEAFNIKALKFNPVRPVVSLVYNTRDHRKYIIIDNKIAYTGGLNIADEYINVVERFGYWKDTMIRIQGAAVWNISQMFLTMWNAYKSENSDDKKFIDQASLDESLTIIEENSASGYVQPFSDTPLDSEVIGENVYREILNTAERYVYIFTPYLIISYELQTAMTLAAKRGVDVRLMTPGIPDKKMVYRITRSFYRPLMESGIKIYEYTPGFLHAKSFVADDRVAIVGTLNLDYRSLYLHFETATLLYYHPEIKAIKDDFIQAQSVSKLIRLKHLRRSIVGRVIDALLRLLAPFV